MGGNGFTVWKIKEDRGTVLNIVTANMFLEEKIIIFKRERERERTFNGIVCICLCLCCRLPLWKDTCFVHHTVLSVLKERERHGAQGQSI